MTNNVHMFRTSKGWTQKELSERSGVSLRTVVALENNETNPRNFIQRKLCAAFGIPYDQRDRVFPEGGFIENLNREINRGATQ